MNKQLERVKKRMREYLAKDLATEDLELIEILLDQAYSLGQLDGLEKLGALIK